MVTTGCDHDELPPVALVGHRHRHIRRRQFGRPDFLAGCGFESPEGLIRRRPDKGQTSRSHHRSADADRAIFERQRNPHHLVQRAERCFPDDVTGRHVDACEHIPRRLDARREQRREGLLGTALHGISIGRCRRFGVAYDPRRAAWEALTRIVWISQLEVFYREHGNEQREPPVVRDQHVGFRVVGPAAPVIHHPRVNQKAAFGRRREQRAVIVIVVVFLALGLVPERETPGVFLGGNHFVQRTWFDREGLCRRQIFAGQTAFGVDRLLLDFNERLAGLAIEQEGQPLLGQLHDGGTGFAVSLDFDGHRFDRGIPVPDIVADDLVVPDAFTGRGAQRDRRVGVQVIALPVDAVVVGRRAAGGQEHQVAFRIGRHVGPDVAAARFRHFFRIPGCVGRVARVTRNRIPEPLEITVAGVKCIDGAARCIRIEELGADDAADDDPVADDSRRKIGADRIDVMSMRNRADRFGCVEFATVRESRAKLTGSGIHRENPALAGHLDDRVFAQRIIGRFGVRPLRDAATFVLQIRQAFLDLRIKLPPDFAGSRIEGDDFPERVAEHQVSAGFFRQYDRHGLQAEGIAEARHLARVIAGANRPGDFELVNIVQVDLVER